MDQLTSRQLSEWEAYDRLEPIGQRRDDYRMAILSSLIVNLTRQVHGKKGVKMTTPEDFVPDWGGDRKEVGPLKQSTEEQKKILLGIVKAHNKSIKK